MNPLSLIPTGWLLPGAAIAGIALAGALGAQTLRLANARAELATARAGYAEERTKAAEAAAKVLAEYRAREQGILTDHERVEREAIAKLAALDADLGRTRAAAGSLRGARDAAVAAGRAAAACGSASQPGGATGGDSIGVLADVLGRADERAGIVAEFADRTRIAHEACISEYGAVRRRMGAGLP